MQNKHLVKQLVVAGASIDALPNVGRSVLEMVLDNRDFSFVCDLFELMPPEKLKTTFTTLVNSKSFPYPSLEGFLHFAYEKKKRDVVKQLITAGVPVGEPNFVGRSVLNKGVKSRDFNFVSELFEQMSPDNLANVLEGLVQNNINILRKMLDDALKENVSLARKIMELMKSRLLLLTIWEDELYRQPLYRQPPSLALHRLKVMINKRIGQSGEFFSYP